MSGIWNQYKVVKKNAKPGDLINAAKKKDTKKKKLSVAQKILI